MKGKASLLLMVSVVGLNFSNDFDPYYANESAYNTSASYAQRPVRSSGMARLARIKQQLGYMRKEPAIQAKADSVDPIFNEQIPYIPVDVAPPADYQPVNHIDDHASTLYSYTPPVVQRQPVAAVSRNHHYSASNAPVPQNHMNAINSSYSGSYEPRPPMPSTASSVVHGNGKLVQLLEKCQVLGPWLDQHGEKADKARDMYRKHCLDVVSVYAVEHRLDVFYPIQAKILSFLGDHQQASQWLTMYYQSAPLAFDSNYMMLQNLIQLGHYRMAAELYGFYKTQQIKVNPSQEQAISQLIAMIPRQIN